MTKVKALLLTIVCTATAIVGAANQQTIPLLAFGAGAVLFFSIWLYKYLRDRSIITQAKRAKARSAHTATPTVTFTGDRYGQLLANYIQLGVHLERKEGFLVSSKDRYSGMYILGQPGGGKSGLMLNLIQQDTFSGKSVIAIDAHGDLTEKFIASLPDELLPEIREKIYLLDMEDEEYPFSINPFALPMPFTRLSAVAQARAIDLLMHVFEVLWPEVMSQHYLPRYLRATIIALFYNPGSTLLNMYTFLTNDAFRHRLLQNVTDQSVRQFWQMQYDDLSMAQRIQRVEPLVGRLESLMMGRSLIRNIIGQPETSINFRRAIENREVILIRLPLKTVAQDARLIGTLLIALIHATIFSFADVPEEQRPGFSLYIDEFEHFVTSDIGEMFTEGRKFGVRVTVAHQYRSQLPAFLQASTMTARNIICFQTTPEDAREMAHLFLGGEAAVQPENLETDVVKYLLMRGGEL